MRRGIVVFLFVGLISAALQSARSGDADKAKQIIERGIKAAGGEAVLKKHRTATWREKGTYYGMGDGLPYTGNFAVQWPDKFRMEIEGVFTVGVDGKKGWVKMGDMTREMSEEEINQHMYQMRAGWIATLLPLKDKAYNLSATGEVQIGEKPAVSVNVSRNGYPDVKLFFDTKTGLLVKSEFRNKAAEQGYQEVAQETFYQNYREVAGHQVPAKIVVKRDGKQYIEAENSEWTAHKRLDAKLFAMP